MISSIKRWFTSLPAKAHSVGPILFGLMKKYRRELICVGIGFLLAFFLFALSSCVSTAPTPPTTQGA